MKRFSILVTVMVALCACESKAPPAPQPVSSSETDYHAVADMKQLMNWVLDPSSDLIWGAVGSITTEEGEKNLAPETDEQWTAIRNAAAIVAESGNLLLMPGRVRDRDWVKHAQELTKTAQVVLAAAEAKDTDSLFTAGGDMYLVCTACHQQFALDVSKVN